MNLSKCILDSIQHIYDDRAEEAMVNICPAGLLTAEKQYEGEDEDAFRKFFKDNFDLMADVAFGSKSKKARKIGYHLPHINPDPEVSFSIEDIFTSSAILCLHEKKLPEYITFTSDNIITAEKDSVILPANLVFGLILAVILSPVNAEMKAEKTEIINYRNIPLPLNHLWGRKSEFTWLDGMLQEVARIQHEQR